MPTVEPEKAPPSVAHPEPRLHPKTPPPPEPQRPPPPNPEAVRRGLIGADLAFSRASEEKGPSDAFYEFMASDGICLFAGELPIQGRDTVKLHLAAQPQGTLTWKPSEAEAAGDGELGYTWGNYQFGGTNKDGQPRTTFGKYVILWKRQGEAPWRASLYATSPSPAPVGRR